MWLRIGLTSFGGPAGQIALMHRLLVEEKRWISEDRFLHAPRHRKHVVANMVAVISHGTQEVTMEQTEDLVHPMLTSRGLKRRSETERASTPQQQLSTLRIILWTL